jgi:F-type H+-transporting ATPase subunit gamma
MAGASINGIKSRIKSVEGTMQITKAMELVATSKLRRAKEKVEKARPYYEVLTEAILNLKNSNDASSLLWFNPKVSKKTLYIVIAGDRGLAGGYNANVFRLTEALSKNEDALFIPIGKKALEYFKHRKKSIASEKFGYVQDVGVGDSMEIAEIASALFKSGEVGKVSLVYTKFVSMITQTPVYEELLPFSSESEKSGEASMPVFDIDVEEMLDKLVPEYVGGIIYSAICEASAAESGARRTSMNSANKNAEEMIGTLMLKYNRARQAVITQEITEIVSGAEAL